MGISDCLDIENTRKMSAHNVFFNEITAVLICKCIRCSCILTARFRYLGSCDDRSPANIAQLQGAWLRYVIFSIVWPLLLNFTHI